MRYKIGICDDETGVCSMLENFILDYCRFNGVDAECEVWTTGDALIADLRKDFIPDVLFLDIELPGGNGVEVGDFIRKELENQKMEIVYISSKTSYAMELFHIHPYDFLVKPISQEAVFAVLDSVLGQMGTQSCYRAHVAGMDRVLDFDDICYFASQNKHIEIHLTNGEVLSFVGKLRDEIGKLPGYFSRINQSFAVNLHFVESSSYREVTLRNGERLSVSSPYRSEWKKRLAYLAENGR